MLVRPPENMPGLAGIFVGGCVERGEGSSFRAKAHAHNWPGDHNYGWVCVRSAKRLGRFIVLDDLVWDAELVKPSQLIWHEYAHITTPNHGHDDAWRRTMKSLGQPIRKQYQKRTRQGKGEENV